MLNYHIKSSGPLFKSKNSPKELIKEALDETSEWALRLIKSRTPVITGRLQSGWNTSISGHNIILDNSVPYAPYVEKRILMVSRTIPEVKQKLNNTLTNKIDKLK